MSALPSAARVVIIGGGIMGCSTAYHLAGLGWRDVVVLEQARLTGGSTHHAAGLVGQLRANANVTRLLTDSVALYARLEAETGQATGWKRNGGLRMATTPDRLMEIKRQATMARSFGLEMHVLGAAEAGRMWPPMDTTGVLGAAFLPGDG
jgi:4-methylaminobutanoate oxidase (formaldehyde-forming)